MQLQLEKQPDWHPWRCEQSLAPLPDTKSSADSTEIALDATQLNSGKFSLTNREVSLSGLEGSSKLITPCVSFSHLSP